MAIYKKKNFGLDIIRSIAILLVLICHTVPNNNTMYNFGFFGVELFFVLSGFLIGQILFVLFPVIVNEMDLLKWINACDIFSMTSVLINGDYEGYGIAVVEGFDDSWHIAQKIKNVLQNYNLISSECLNHSKHMNNLVWRKTEALLNA